MIIDGKIISRCVKGKCKGSLLCFPWNSRQPWYVQGHLKAWNFYFPVLPRMLLWTRKVYQIYKSKLLNFLCSFYLFDFIVKYFVKNILVNIQFANRFWRLPSWSSTPRVNHVLRLSGLALWIELYERYHADVFFKYSGL